MYNQSTTKVFLRGSASRIGDRELRVRTAVVALVVMLTLGFGGAVLAQSPQPGTPAQAIPVPGENSPPAEAAPQAEADPDLMLEEEEEDEGGEGCPYLGTPLELTV